MGACPKKNNFTDSSCRDSTPAMASCFMTVIAEEVGVEDGEEGSV